MVDDLKEAWADLSTPAPVCPRCKGRKVIPIDYCSDAPCPDCEGPRGVPELPIREVRVGRHAFQVTLLHNREHWINLLPTAGRGWMIQGFLDARHGQPANYNPQRNPLKLYWTRQLRWVQSDVGAQDLDPHEVEFLPHELESMLSWAIAGKTENMYPV